MPSVVVRSRGAARRCAICHDDIAGRARLCRLCSTVLHDECFVGKCPTFGCRNGQLWIVCQPRAAGGRTEGAPASGARGRAEPLRGPEAVVTSLLFSLLSGLSGIGLVGLAWDARWYVTAVVVAVAALLAHFIVLPVLWARQVQRRPGADLRVIVGEIVFGPIALVVSFLATYLGGWALGLALLGLFFVLGPGLIVSLMR